MSDRLTAARTPRDDEGTIGILTLGFAVLAIMLILVISAATAVHLQRLRLTHLADELAEDAADSIDSSGYFTSTVGVGDVELAESAMREAVEAHVSERGTGQLDGVRLVSVDAPDATTARVTVEMTVYPLFGLEALMPFADGITLTSTGQARTF